VVLKKKVRSAVAKSKRKSRPTKAKPKAKNLKQKAKKSPKRKAAPKKVAARKPPGKKTQVRSTLANKSLPKKAPAQIMKGAHKTALTSSTAKGGATTISVYKPEIEASDLVVVPEKRLVMPPPVRAQKPGKKAPALKPIKTAPVPFVLAGEESWSVSEIKAVRSELSKDLVRLKKELEAIESEMDDLIEASGVGAGDDQADAGAKTFEREHEISLVYNARDMVLQTERALERIDTKTYGRCEDCGSAIGKARLQVFPRATLCMLCKQKEERR